MSDAEPDRDRALTAAWLRVCDGTRREAFRTGSQVGFAAGAAVAALVFLLLWFCSRL